MKLDAARLCLDCDEIHEEQNCPSCSSEAFAFVTRWVKTSGEHRLERRAAPVVQPATATVHPPRTPEQIEAYRQLIEGKPEKGPGPGLVTKGVFGIAAVSLLGWAWRSRSRPDGSVSDSGTPDGGRPQGPAGPRAVRESADSGRRRRGPNAT